jgi:Protein of unknown function (DUF732)
MRSLAAGLLLAVATAAGAALAAPGHADAADDAFLSLLHSKGIKFDSPESAITAAHEVCAELDQGRTKSDVAGAVMSNSNLDGYHAGYFVGVSIKSYCPGHGS